MSGDGSHAAVVQFLVQGFGSDEGFRRRLAIEELVGRVPEADGNGASTGGDGGSGTKNAFFAVKGPRKARGRALQALRDAGQLDEGLVVVHEPSRQGTGPGLLDGGPSLAAALDDSQHHSSGLACGAPSSAAYPS